MDCNIFYRISSESYPKEKVPGATKERCLENFIRVFGDKFVVIADNCHEPLLQYLEARKLKIMETNLGNAGSFRHALNLATTLHPESVVYFVEDDYIHLPTAPKLILEAVQYADYVTAYDHPDKYGPYYDGGEVSKVFRTKSSHWRFTQSTTMTFAAQVKTLREDYPEWLQATEGAHPNDHGTFCLLGERKGRTVACSVPGAACHMDLTYSGQVGSDTIEDWATMTVIGDTLQQMEEWHWRDANKVLGQMERAGMTFLQQAAALDVLVQKWKKGG